MPGQLLEEVGGESDSHSLPAVDTAVLEAIRPCSNFFSFDFENILDLFDLQLDVRVISGSATQCSHRGHTAFNLAGAEEIAGRLWQERHQATDDNAEDDLEGTRETPGDAGRVVGHAIVEPVGKNESDDQV